MAVITISRQFGAAGKTMGKIIAKKLGYTFVDNDIIQMVAEKTKVSTDWVRSMEKEAGNKLLKFMSGLVSKSFMERVLEDKRGYIDEEIYVDALHTIIAQIADEGNAVILGRGSQYILKDREDVFHLLLVADREDRVKFMEEHYDLTPKQADQVVSNEEKRRVNLYRKFGKEDYDQPYLYHMVLNMSRLTLEKATELVCSQVPS
jgi:cytidylate kinase